MIAKRIFTISASILFAAFGYTLKVRAVTAGIYTADQAKRGLAVYSAQCAFCHGADLAGIGQNPPLSGEEFLSKYQGESIVALFDTIHTTMPATHPGSMTRPQTAAVLAYLLSSNKYLVGTADLPSDDGSLKKIQLDKPSQ